MGTGRTGQLPRLIYQNSFDSWDLPRAAFGECSLFLGKTDRHSWCCCRCRIFWPHLHLTPLNAPFACAKDAAGHLWVVLDLISLLFLLKMGKLSKTISVLFPNYFSTFHSSLFALRFSLFACRAPSVQLNMQIVCRWCCTIVNRRRSFPKWFISQNGALQVALN